MDNRINNNISFQANLVTSIKGRSNIMEAVAKEFAKMTKDIPGDFNIQRVKDLGLTAKDHYLQFSYKTISFITDQFQNLLSQDYSKAGRKEAKAIAQKLEANLRALAAEDKYNKDSERVLEKFNELRGSVKRAETAKRRADYYKLNDLSDIYSTTIANYKEELSKITKRIKNMQQHTLKQIDEFKDKGIDLETYKESVVDTFSDQLL